MCFSLSIGQALIHEVVTKRPFHLSFFLVVADMFSMKSEVWSSDTLDIISSVGQRYSWRLVVFDLLGWLRVRLSGGLTRIAIDKFRFLQHDGFCVVRRRM